MSEATPTIRNRVDESGLTTIDLDDLISRESMVPFDLADCLENGLILREKPFRETLKNLKAADWFGKVAVLHCSNDAIVQEWAWMLATSQLTACGAKVGIGSPDDVRQAPVSYTHLTLPTILLV